MLSTVPQFIFHPLQALVFGLEKGAVGLQLRDAVSRNRSALWRQASAVFAVRPRMHGKAMMQQWTGRETGTEGRPVVAHCRPCIWSPARLVRSTSGEPYIRPMSSLLKEPVTRALCYRVASVWPSIYCGLSRIAVPPTLPCCWVRKRAARREPRCARMRVRMHTDRSSDARATGVGQTV